MQEQLSKVSVLILWKVSQEDQSTLLTSQNQDLRKYSLLINEFQLDTNIYWTKKLTKFRAYPKTFHRKENTRRTDDECFLMVHAERRNRRE